MDDLGDKLFVTLKNESRCLLMQKGSRSVVHVQCSMYCADKQHPSLELSWMPVALAQEAQECKWLLRSRNTVISALKLRS